MKIYVLVRSLDFTNSQFHTLSKNECLFKYDGGKSYAYNFSSKKFCIQSYDIIQDMDKLKYECEYVSEEYANNIINNIDSMRELVN